MKLDVSHLDADQLHAVHLAAHDLDPRSGPAVLSHAVIRSALTKADPCPPPWRGDVVLKLDHQSASEGEPTRTVVINGTEYRLGERETVRLGEDGSVAVVAADAPEVEKRHQPTTVIDLPVDTRSNLSASNATTTNPLINTYGEAADAATATLGVLKGLSSGNSHGTGAMVAFMLDPDDAQVLAREGGEPAESLHVTLRYLGDAALYTPTMREWVIERVREAVADRCSIAGQTAGLGRFTTEDDQHPIWAAVDIAGLEDLQAAICEALPIADQPQTHGFTPHITLGYTDADDPTPDWPEVAGVPLTIKAVSVIIGDERVDVPLGEVEESEVEEAEPEVMAKSRGTVRKSDALRYSLSAWYIPDQEDAHGEWTDADELQQAAWRYTRRGDRRIRLQHDTETIAGEWVEIISWPYEVTLPKLDPEGGMTEVTYPAGTVFLGVVWEEWAWELVLAGKLRGLSIGGTALRVDLGDQPLAA